MVALQNNRILASQWSQETATELFWTILPVNNWEPLATECGWSTQEYMDRITALLKSTFISPST